MMKMIFAAIALSGMALSGCVSSGPASNSGSAAGSDYKVVSYGTCSLLFDGDQLVTTYNRKRARTTAYATGRGCKKLYPDAANVGSFLTMERMEFDKHFVRMYWVRKPDNVNMKAIIRKDAGRYTVSHTEI